MNCLMKLTWADSLSNHIVNRFIGSLIILHDAYVIIALTAVDCGLHEQAVINCQIKLLDNIVLHDRYRE